jgi:hypothetical protein
MAGSLIKVDEVTVSSSIASIIIGGGSSGSSGLNYAMDSTYDVYILHQINVKPSNNQVSYRLRFTAGGTPQTSALYDRAQQIFRSDTAWNTNAIASQTASDLEIGVSNTTGGVHSTQYIFNASNASGYTYYTNESSRHSYDSQNLRGMIGGGVYRGVQAIDGVQLYFSAGDITSAKFVLYGLKK